MAVHGSDENKPLACVECGKRFLSNSALACHLKVHATEMFSYDCPICSEPFQQIHALKEHVHVHRINNVYTCPRCMKVNKEQALWYMIKLKRFKKIAWIRSHHFHLQWKFKLLAKKFTKHCWLMSTNFLFSNVCWQWPAIFCLYTSTKLSRP